ncbi:hypothetical protein NMG60_11017472 [Bertholletia excelsa]
MLCFFHLLLSVSLSPFPTTSAAASTRATTLCPLWSTKPTVSSLQLPALLHLRQPTSPIVFLCDCRRPSAIVSTNAGHSFASAPVDHFQRKSSEMCSSAETLRAAKVYRDLLKSIKKHIGREEYKSHFTEFVSQEFRKQSEVSSAYEKIKLARDYTSLLNSIHHHKDLLFSYNIAVDRSDEMRRILGKSAASVGLRLPEVYQS